MSQVCLLIIVPVFLSQYLPPLTSIRPLFMPETRLHSSLRPSNLSASPVGIFKLHISGHMYVLFVLPYEITIVKQQT